MSNLLNKNFSQDIDVAFFTYEILKKLKAGEVNTFDNRLKSQKVQYLAQVFGVSPIYDYNLYIHGPYSPSLANDLFIINSNNKKQYFKDIPETLLPLFNSLKDFISDKDNRKLELVTTTHLFLKVFNLSIDNTKQKLKSIKKASNEEIEYSLNEFNKIPC